MSGLPFHPPEEIPDPGIETESQETQFLSLGQESPPEEIPDPGIETESPVTLVLAGGSFTTEPPGKPPDIVVKSKNKDILSYFIFFGIL